MSLLRTLRIPQLRAATRPAYAACMSSLPGSALPGSGEKTGVAYEEEQPADSMDFLSELDDVPPRAPESAYPSSYATNPVSATKDMMPVPRTREAYSLYVSSTNNNNILTFTRPDGGPICTVSSGMVGFKNKNRANPEAAHAAAMRIFARIAQEAEVKGRGNMVLEVKFRGFAKGREAVYKALLGAEGDSVRPLVNRLTDMTPIKIGGTRAKKARRT
ncbi:hypothetical protein PHLGIDRAFT_19117 [Phlebiopsis gigantea 11061_1 CR5-6]|uniref:Translational machinery component n=1 Tax=Phlebiopsis gigantea (strain 11061_1 CR5-6) TaxID=745531 RepID=A0A0C3RZD5_PHLG1|nr:hypothetical protein PHLGIDRAFT_19117 [Phlebiopsis gigantea 11061_1 CR5-6]